MNSIVPPLVLGGAIAGGAIAGGIAGGIILSSPIFQMKTLVPTLAPSIMVPAPPPDLVDFDPTTTVRTGAKTTFLIDSTLFPTRSEVDGIMVNGVDIMTFDDAGKIIEFKVMVRPLKAVNLLHAKMQAMLEQMSA